MFFRHSLDKLIYPVVVLALLAIISFRPKYHLSTTMPPGFFQADDDSAASHGQERIAWAYWESARMDIQWKYPHAHPLPQEPPAEFRIEAKALGPAATDPAIRMLYWHRLQQVWYLPDTWKKEYEWDWGWVGDPITAASQWIKDRADRLFTIR